MEFQVPGKRIIRFCACARTGQDSTSPSKPTSARFHWKHCCQMAVSHSQLVLQAIIELLLLDTLTVYSIVLAEQQVSLH